MRSSVIKPFLTNLLCLMAIAVVAVAIGIKHLNEAPAFIHAWAQADRYALAVGFTENGHDLFHPQTMIYNKQFPHTRGAGGGERKAESGKWKVESGEWWKVDDGSTVTAVDLPLHEYIVGWLMTLFGTTAPWVFRGFTLLVSVAGLWFLYLLARRLTGSWLPALLPAVVAMTSPLYAYYFANYLPSAPALALSMAGLWAYGRYWGAGGREQGADGCLPATSCLGWWHLAIGLVALATMIRSSQAVLLVALCAFEGLRAYVNGKRKVESGKWNKLPSVLVAGVAIVGYMLWNGHLRDEYGSVFLSELMPPRHAEDVQTVMDEIRWHWRFEYFSRLQHWLVAVACVVAAVLLIRGRVAGSREQGAAYRLPATGCRLSLGWLAVIWWVGELCFFVAMFRQYQNHDYYFLDSFFLPVLFTFILALGKLAGSGKLKTENGKLKTESGKLKTENGKLKIPAICYQLGALAALALLSGVMYNEAKHKVADRLWEGDRAYITSQHFQGADRWLDEQGVPRDAKILAFLAYPQNGPLLQMGRKGYTVMAYDEALVAAALQFPYDYVVMEDERKGEAAEVIGHWELMADNGTLSLFKRKTENGKLKTEIWEMKGK